MLNLTSNMTKLGATAFLLVSTTISANALPTGGQVTYGNATITNTTNSTLINQSTNRADINWHDFSSNAGETIKFVQPSSNSVTINRVTGGLPSNLAGALEANGRVVVINDSGITFQGTSRTNVGSLIASTAKSYSVEQSKNGGEQINFYNSSGKIQNDGVITTNYNSREQFVVLAAPVVVNNGTISLSRTSWGSIDLAAVNNFNVDLSGTGKVNYLTQPKVLEEAKVTNTGTLQALGGYVTLKAEGARKITENVINLTGIVDARGAGLFGGLSGYASPGNVTITSAGDVNISKANVRAEGFNSDISIGGNIKIKAGNAYKDDAETLMNVSTLGAKAPLAGKINITAGRSAAINGTYDASTVNTKTKGSIVLRAPVLKVSKTVHKTI